MEAKAVARFVRISPRKARQVANLIKNKDVHEAMAILKYTSKRGAEIISKVLKSAVANAEHNYEMDPDNLYVANAYVDEGPTLKRYRPRAMGRADLIRKRTSHITVVVREKEEVN
ncbi:MAG: 50S ribosomal protein L22 [Thermoanaerobacteraceae bacterium]|nr:50S ribosomal protein L22 [Thermoanaerobacteraceae bacterium]